MKLSEFQKPAPPVSGSGSDVPPTEPPAASQEAPQEEQYYTSITPSGIEVAYSPAPRRHYKLRGNTPGMTPNDDWQEVPSVTSVLGVLEKPQLVWWGQGIGVEGVLTLLREGRLRQLEDVEVFYDVLDEHSVSVSKDRVVRLLTEHKLTVNHQRDKAADRGVNVHEALENWCLQGALPDSECWPENERGYVEGLYQFLSKISYSTSKQPECELMVGSLEHSYAGRFDLVLTLSKPVEVVTRCYPKKPPKIETIPAGRYLMDLKTRKKASVYNTNFLQLEAYEHAAVECGYQPTDYRAVIVVTEDGGYQLSVNKDWCFDDFLAVRRVYSVLNEREVLRVLREDLDAKEIA